MSAAPSRVDPRPLTGEPLPLDLLNTRWLDGEVERDLLDDVDGLGAWLAGHGFDGPADEETLAALRRTRAALAGVVDRDDAGAHRELNEVLRHGRLRRAVGPDGPVTEVEADSPAWLPAWSAAEGYLRLVERAPDRIRHCAHPRCVLHFFDTSRNGTRRWCSMATCGNRVKASRHHERTA
ncbi:putative RNA-binding Zn ribbon-like protein [Actinomycetospora succinea]|uniref:Putative RNA-binding Zn ribbon-like protein n=1 Tax=Actinomycetospora succinea TaxID=663603 RepID=A0A4R6VMP2_9PSEU|nr:CGNR zinc finger domain-containing protein [Actinomycetospora succinea]TDQ65102.1 putative RNA-binding Zn ribbon-like protein [Actinomycetospora succinea]